ncbi:MFS transporter [Agromyces aerolatus]|uniref:MFS transporter n=1 Tax=Agromyces sp. LY-1074 TaxID=3074080 RepID=UPI00286281CA|nr:MULTISPECIES: MFS transporter [unclassified Agromyces]MDR5701577.1 MFS transporter [Agromyces sp. LY-1074]MDR5706107.1 MFS transporter [Agromyces sp. LY-1358]
MNVRIFFLALGMVASGMNSLLIAGLLPEIAHTLGASEAAVGVSVSVLACTYALTAPFIPIVFSRFSRRAIAIAALIVFLGGVVLSAFAWDIWSFYAARAVVALGTAAYTAQAIAAAIEISPPGRKGAAAAWVSMGFAVSMALGVPVGTLLGEAFGYRSAFLLTAAIAAVTLAGLVSVRMSVRAERSTLRKQFRPLAEPVVLAVLLFTFLYSISFFSVLTYMFPVLEFAADADAAMVTAALALFGICNIVSMAVGGRLIDRFGSLAVILVCVLVMSVATPVLGVPLGPVVAFAAIAAFGLTGSLVGPSTNALLGHMHPTNPATLVGANMSAVQLGAAAGGAVGALMLTGPGANWIAYAAGVAALLSAIVCAGLLRARRAQRASRTRQPRQTEPTEAAA